MTSRGLGFIGKRPSSLVNAAFSEALDSAPASESQRSRNTRSAAMQSITVDGTQLPLRNVSRLSAR